MPWSYGIGFSGNYPFAERYGRTVECHDIVTCPRAAFLHSGTAYHTGNPLIDHCPVGMPVASHYKLCIHLLKFVEHRCVVEHRTVHGIVVYKDYRLFPVYRIGY